MLYAETRLQHGYPDLLNYDYMPAPGIVRLKDGAYLAAWWFQGPDLEGSTPEELAALSAHVNQALCLFGDRWQLHCDAFRVPAVQYPASGAFPDPVTALIDDERRQHHQQAGVHYESHTILTLTYVPVSRTEQMLSGLFTDGTQEHPTDPELTFFATHSVAAITLLSARFRFERLLGANLLTYLHRCATGIMTPLALTSSTANLDYLIGSQSLLPGFAPKVGAMHVRVIGMTGLPRTTHPSLLSFLNALPCAYRWNTRFIFLDPQTARQQLSKKRVQWTTKVNSLMSVMVEAFTKKPPRYVNNDARSMADDANDALAVCDSGLVRFGYVTPTLVLYHEDLATIQHTANAIVTEMRNHGFPARIEEDNAIEAFLGSLPGHGYPNVRKPIVHSLNVADLLPITAVWAGLEQNPNPYFPPNCPALIHCATNGNTPFRLNFHVSDVGNSLIVGPIGAGKTTLLGLAHAQWFRYPNAQVFCFDRDYGSMLLTKACGGSHYTLEASTKLALCPLAKINDPQERAWAAWWLESVVQVQGVGISPAQRNEIARALTLLAESPYRTLSDFCVTIQDHPIREALHPYTKEGPLGWLLDGHDDGLSANRFQTFDLTALMNAGTKQLIPTLLYLFHYIDRRLNGSPTLITIDEAWMTLLNAAFAEQVEEWVRTLRKKNAAMVFVTQSVADIANHPRKAILLESCPTRIFLANPGAATAHVRPQYEALGLNPKAIEIISTMLPKKDYYYHSPLGARQFELALGPIALSFLGAGGSEDRRKWQAMEKVSRSGWVPAWLKYRGLETAALTLKQEAV